MQLKSPIAEKAAVARYSYLYVSVYMVTGCTFIFQSVLQYDVGIPLLSLKNNKPSSETQILVENVNKYLNIFDTINMFINNVNDKTTTLKLVSFGMVIELCFS